MMCRNVCLRRADRRPLSGFAFVAVLLVLGAASAVRGAGLEEARALYDSGSFEGAYQLAVAEDDGAAQTLAANAAIAQAIYRDLPDADRLSWLRRAQDAGRRAVALLPEAPQALLALAQARGEMALRTSALDNLSTAGEIGDLLKRAVAAAPDDPDALVGLGMWNLGVTDRGVGWLYGARREGALELVARGVSLAPQRVNLRVQYATALRDAGDRSLAVEQLREALTLPTPTAVDRYERERAVTMLRELAPSAP
jgi:tetratricopeptide (TPR) repeat protein